MTWAAVAIGGALGSMARHGVNAAVSRLTGNPVPFATFTVNVIGCLAIGVLAGMVASGRLPMSSTVRAFVFVGILGGFTTFSTFGLDTLVLVREGAAAVAFWNVAGQVALGLAAVYAGYAIAT